MSTTPMGPDRTEGPLTARRIRLAVAAVAVAVVAVVTGLLLTGGGGEPTAAAAGSADPTSVSPTPTAPTEAAGPTAATPTGAAPPEAATPTAATAPTEGGDQPPPTLAPVPLGDTAAVGDGVTASVVSLEAFEGEARGPGNVAGPALRATVRLTNGTASPVSLDGVTVGLAYGPELVPASPLEDPSQAPFAGTAGPGGTAEAAYVFSVPSDVPDPVTVSVGYRAGAPVLVFTGPTD